MRIHFIAGGQSPRRIMCACVMMAFGVLLSCVDLGQAQQAQQMFGQAQGGAGVAQPIGKPTERRARRRAVTGPSQISWVLNNLPTPAPQRLTPEPATQAYSFAQRVLNDVVSEDGRHFYARQIPNPTPVPVVYPPTPLFNTHRNLPRLNCSTAADVDKFPSTFQHALPTHRFAIRASEELIGGSQMALEADSEQFPEMYIEMLYLLGYSHWEDVYESSATVIYDMRGKQLRAVEMPANPRFRAIKRLNSTAQIMMSWYMFHPISDRYGAVNHHGDYRHHVNGTPPVAWVSAACIHNDGTGDISCSLHKDLVEGLPLGSWNAAACHHDMSYNQRTGTYVALCHYADKGFAQEFSLNGTLLRRMDLFQEAEKEQHFNSIFWYDDPLDRKRSLLLVNDYFRGMYLYNWDTQELLWFISPTTMKAAPDAFLPKLLYNTDVEITRKLHDVQPLPDGRFIGFANLPRAGWLIFRVEKQSGVPVGMVERAFLANHGQGAIGAVSMLPDGNVMCLWCPPPSPIGGRCEAAVTSQNYNLMWWGVVQLQKKKLQAMAFRFTPFYIAPLVEIEQKDTTGMAFCVSVRTAQLQRQWTDGCVVVEDEQQRTVWSENVQFPPLWQRTRFCVPSSPLNSLAQRPSNIMWRLRVWDPQGCQPASIAIMGGAALSAFAEAQSSTSTCVTKMQCPSGDPIY